MILIIGSTHDDVLYFESLATNRNKSVLFNRYPVTFGKLFNQEVAIVSEIYTNYISSIVTSYFIDKFFVILVLSVGTCVGYSSDCEPLTVAISEKVTLADVDQLAVRPVSIGQIPNGYPTFFTSDNDAKEIIKKSFETKTTVNYFEGTFFSSNTFYTREEQLEPLKSFKKLTPIESHAVFDCTYGGIALACEMHKVACVALKVVESKFGTKVNYQDYSKILETFISVGRGVSAALIDIGSNDILEGKV
jgi:nucleoside phosphorylase